ncbi:hypothetical protein MRB53_037812 [Persea americana]|nr:hypothetical protein MRB53_037812 [Persea americana]
MHSKASRQRAYLPRQYLNSQPTSRQPHWTFPDKTNYEISTIRRISYECLICMAWRYRFDGCMEADQQAPSALRWRSAVKRLVRLPGNVQSLQIPTISNISTRAKIDHTISNSFFILLSVALAATNKKGHERRLPNFDVSQ